MDKLHASALQQLITLTSYDGIPQLPKLFVLGEIMHLVSSPLSQMSLFSDKLPLNLDLQNTLHNHDLKVI